MELEFWKLSGAGNDFVAINNMDGKLPEEGRGDLISKWCRRGMSIGADGALILESAQGDGAHFRMRYYNADGGEAETCGNGSRCIARFAYLQGVAPEKMTFETTCGPYAAEVLPNGEVRVRLADAHSWREKIQIVDDVFEGETYFLNTGVPHVVTQVDDVSTVEVERAGRHLRYHKEFAPAGTNVNFVRLRDPRNLEVRTYERGVEAETLACGTGCIASSITFARLGLVEPPVRVKTASGEYLTISFEPTQGGARNVTLQGSAHVVFRGYIDVPQLAEALAS